MVALKSSHGSAATKQISNQERVTLKTVGNFMALLLALAPPTSPWWSSKEVAQFLVPSPLTVGKKWNLSAIFWHVCGLPQELISILPDLELSCKWWHSLDFRLETTKGSRECYGMWKLQGTEDLQMPTDRITDRKKKGVETSRVKK